MKNIYFNLQRFGVIAGSNKRRVTLHDVKKLYYSMCDVGYLQDKPITYIWSNDPRLKGYKIKAFKSVVYEFSNMFTKITSEFLDIPPLLGSEKELETKEESYYSIVEKSILTDIKCEYEESEEPYRVILDGKRRLIAAAALKDADVPLVELAPDVSLTKYLYYINPVLLR